MNAALRWVVLGSPLGFAQDSKPTIEVLEAEAAEHRIGARGPIYTNLGDEDLAVTLEVVVGPDGKTLYAKNTLGFTMGDLALLWKTGSTSPLRGTAIR
jgi:hypothetical protein